MRFFVPSNDVAALTFVLVFPRRREPPASDLSDPATLIEGISHPPKNFVQALPRAGCSERGTSGLAAGGGAAHVQ